MKTVDINCILENDVIKGFSSIKIGEDEEIHAKEDKIISSSENEEEEEKIISLDWVDPVSKERAVDYIPKGPIHRDNKSDSHKYVPYERNPPGNVNDCGIPQMAQRNDSEVNMDVMKYMMGYQDDGLYIWYEDDPKAQCVVVPYLFKIDLENQCIGFNIPRLQVPDHIKISGETLLIYIKVYPNSPRSFDVEALVEEYGGKGPHFLKSQFISMSAKVKSNSGLLRIMAGLTKADIDSAVRIVDSKSEVELFKTYGDNKDTLLSMLCFSRDHSASNRAKVLALTRKILGHTDLKYRTNLTFKNESDINALEFAATTNKGDIAAYISELFYVVGEDVLCTDPEGNTILHMQARKGDVVAPSLKALLDITLKNEEKMFPASVCNNLGQTPMHIAARGSDTADTLQILFEAYPDAIKTKSLNNSLPLHMACQYSSDPAVIKTLLEFEPNVVNEVQMDGYSPLHLLAHRGNQDASPMDELHQLEVVKDLLAKGADVNKTVSGRIPFDLVVNERIKVKLLLKLSHGCPEGTLPDSRQNLNSAFYHQNENGQFFNGRDFDDLNNYRDSRQDDLKLALNYLNSPSYSSGFESSPSSVQSASTQSKASSAETTPAHPGLSLSPTNTDPIYQYSPTNSNMNDFKSSEDEDEEDLDAIAQYLYQHPTIQNAINMAEKLQ